MQFVHPLKVSSLLIFLFTLLHKYIIKFLSSSLHRLISISYLYLFSIIIHYFYYYYLKVYIYKHLITHHTFELNFKKIAKKKWNFFGTFIHVCWDFVCAMQKFLSTVCVQVVHTNHHCSSFLV